MSRRYEFKDLVRATKILEALVPDGVKVNTVAIRDGFGCTITVCGAASCENYSFGPGVTEYQLLRIAEQWRNGEKTLIDSRFDPTTAVAQETFVDEPEALAAWARAAKKGDRVVYFIGDLATFRYNAQRAINKLETRQDALPAGATLPDGDGFRLLDLRQKIDTFNAISMLEKANVIAVVQLRMTDGTGYTYYAAKR